MRQWEISIQYNFIVSENELEEGTEEETQEQLRYIAENDYDTIEPDIMIHELAPLS